MERRIKMGVKKMQKMNSAALTVVMMLLAIPNAVNAESWICEQGNLVRGINIELETSAAAPCSVVYDKGSEGGGSNVLWTARNDGAYCSAKADGLAEKLKGFGWKCSAF
jgi:hypothetical protein